MFLQELKVVRDLYPLLRPYRARFSLFSVLAFFESLSEGVGISMFIPLLSSLDESTFEIGEDQWFGGQLWRLFETTPASHRLLIIAGCIFVLVSLRSLLSYSSSVVAARTDMKLDQDLRSKVVNQFFDVSLREIERTEPGKLMNVIESVTAATSEAVWTVSGLVVNTCSILVLAGLLLLLSWKLTLVVGAVLVLISLVLKLLTSRVEAVSQRSLEAHQDLSQRALELLKGSRTIRTFAREDYERERFSEVSRQASQQSFDFLKLYSLISPVGQLLAGTLLIVVLLATLTDPSHLPTVLVFVFILYRLHPQVLEADEARATLVAAGPSVGQLRDLLDPTDKEYLPSGRLPFTGLQDGIRLSGVSFRYGPEEPWVLRDVSVEIPRGQMTALVGTSGAGKSTFINLLLRHYDPNAGEISVDGVPLRNLDIATWKDRLAVASQDTHIFNTTVSKNIAYGRLAATPEEIVAAAKQADAHEFISALPEGYETIAGDQGVRLSGGQRQRIALARAIIRDAEILILDEAINALDSISEHVIHESIKNLGKDRTVIIIAHRLSTIEQADQIIVLDAGRVQDQGRVADLLEKEALFKRLYDLHPGGTGSRESQPKLE